MFFIFSANLGLPVSVIIGKKFCLMLLCIHQEKSYLSFLVLSCLMSLKGLSLLLSLSGLGGQYTPEATRTFLMSANFLPLRAAFLHLLFTNVGLASLLEFLDDFWELFSHACHFTDC